MIQSIRATTIRCERAGKQTDRLFAWQSLIAGRTQVHSLSMSWRRKFRNVLIRNDDKQLESHGWAAAVMLGGKMAVTMRKTMAVFVAWPPEDKSEL